MKDKFNLTNKQVKVLLVQDEGDSTEDIRTQAEMNDHIFKIVFEEVHSAARAMELIKTWHPSVILLDAYVEDVNCFEFLEKIRGNYVPVIVTTRDHSPEIERSAEAHGAAGYFPLGEDPDFVEELLFHVADLAEAAEFSQ